MNASMKSAAVASPQLAGQVTFHILPYRTMKTTQVLREIARARNIDISAAAGVMDDDDAVFAVLDSSTVDVDFALSEDAPAEWRAFAGYWQERSSNLMERLDAYYMLAYAVRDAWLDAYEAAQDREGAPGELEAAT